MKCDGEFFVREWQRMGRKEAGSKKFKARCLTLSTTLCGLGFWSSQVLGFCKPGILLLKLQEISECARPKTLQSSQVPKPKKSSKFLVNKHKEDASLTQ